MSDNNSEFLKNYLTGVQKTLDNIPLETISRIVDAIIKAREAGKRVYIFGNGGSSATASHMVCDLAKGSINKEKKRIRPFGLTDNTPMFSAWANDTSYENVFEEQLENYVEPGDIAIAFSGSGNSKNIIKGVLKAKEKGAFTIGFTAFDGGRLKEVADLVVIVPTSNMEQAEDIHLILEHAIAVRLRNS